MSESSSATASSTRAQADGRRYTADEVRELLTEVLMASVGYSTTAQAEDVAARWLEHADIQWARRSRTESPRG